MNADSDEPFWEFQTGKDYFVQIPNWKPTSPPSDQVVPVGPTAPCRHAVPIGPTHPRFFRPAAKNYYQYLIPRVVHTYYDGGYQSITTCLDCVLDNEKAQEAAPQGDCA